MGVSGGRHSVTGLIKPRACRCVLTRYCPTLHRSSCAIGCAIHNLDLRRSGRVVGGHPRLLDLRRVCQVTRDYRPKDRRFGRSFRMTTAVFPSSPVTGLGTKTVRVRGNNSVAATGECLTGTSPGTTRARGGLNVVTVVRKSLSATRGCFGTTGTTNLVGRTSTGLGRLGGGRGCPLRWRGAVARAGDVYSPL